MFFDGILSGTLDLERTFLRMPGGIRRKANMQSLREGAKIVKSSAEQNVKSVVSNEATGFLAKNIRIYNYRKKRGYYRVAVQIRRNALNVKKIVNGAPVRAGMYGAVLEYGKKNQPPRSWIRKAIRDNEAAVIAVVTKEMGRRIEDAVRDAKV